MSATLTERLKAVAGPRATVVGRCLLRGYSVPRWGNLRRTTPFSSTYGFERGTPIDRYYLHQFLAANRALITGRVLEVQHTRYTERFGAGVMAADSFDIVADARPTYVCDLAHCDAVIPSASYDCVLLPNTFQHLRELEPALAQVWRIVSPGGAVLASAAGCIPLTGDAADYWRITPEGWKELLARVWPDGDVSIAGHGNCLSAIGAQLGLAHEELTAAELAVHDPRYPVLTTIRARKPAADGAPRV